MVPPRLGSLRVRQDRLIFEGLEGADKSGTGAPDDPVQLALRRIRQLAAHEVGHSLGLAHNFAASTYGRASVMDYPAPTIGIKDGKLDFSNVYAVGAGAWDVQAIRYGYTEFPPGTDEKAGLDAIMKKGEGFDQMVETMHSNTIGEPIFAGDCFAFTATADMTMKGRGRTTMSELCVYTVKDGKIVSEETKVPGMGSYVLFHDPEGRIIGLWKNA